MAKVQRAAIGPRTEWWRLGWPERFDVLLVVGIVVFYLVASFTPGAAPGRSWPVPLLFALTVFPLFWRTQAPVLVLVVVNGLTWLLLVPVGAVQFAGGSVVLAITAVALGAVAARSRLWLSLSALAGTITSVVLLQRTEFPDSELGWIIMFTSVVCGVAWGLGLWAHRVRRRIRDMEAEQQRVAAAVISERERIASELNSIVSAAVTRMRREVSTAREYFERDRARVVAALTTIEATGVEAMSELRRLLHLIHDNPGLVIDEPVHVEDGSRRSNIADKLQDIDGSDAAVTIGVIVATMALIASGMSVGMPMLASLFLGLAFIVLVWRHHFPVFVFFFVIAAHATSTLLFFDGDFVSDNQSALAAVLVALAAISSGRPVWVSVFAMLVTWGYVSLPAFRYPAVFASTLLTYAFLTASVWLAAFLVGRRRSHIDELRAAEHAAHEAVSTERAQLAYQLHDVTGHSITVMVLQAAGARRIINQDPARAAAALTPIDEAGEEALQELRQLLAVLSEDSASADLSDESRFALANIGRLVERAKRMAPNITYTVHGSPVRLEPSVDAAAYCVARETLSNAVKHSATETHIDLTVSWKPELVQVQAKNTLGGGEARQASTLTGGYGLVSLRERVVLAGGDIQWSSDDTVFTVDAVLPTAAPETYIRPSGVSK